MKYSCVMSGIRPYERTRKFRRLLQPGTTGWAFPACPRLAALCRASSGPKGAVATFGAEHGWNGAWLASIAVGRHHPHPSEIAENIGSLAPPCVTDGFSRLRAKGWLLQNLTDGDGARRAIYA